MEYPHHTPSSRKNKHLELWERGQIKLLHDQGHTAYAIAKILGRAQNTIRNELARGTVIQVKGRKRVKVYFPDSGQMAYERNRKNCCPRYKLLSCERFMNYAVNQVQHKKHSLDAIVGEAREKKFFVMMRWYAPRLCTTT